MLEHIVGWIQVGLLLAISALGEGDQIRRIIKGLRQEDYRRGVGSTSISLYNKGASYGGVLIFAIYGLTTQDPTWYIAAPRFIAAMFLLVTLFLLWWDRRSAWAVFALIGAMLFPVGAYLFFEQIGRESLMETNSLYLFSAVIVVSVSFFAGSLVDQIRLIRRNGTTGRLSKLLFLLSSIKNAFLAVYGLFLDGIHAWIVIFAGTLVSILSACILYHFRWQRISALAQKRYEEFLKQENK